MRVTKMFYVVAALLVYPYKCSYAMHDIVLLSACGDCPDSGLLLTHHIEEGCPLPVLLSCSASQPRSYT